MQLLLLTTTALEYIRHPVSLCLQTYIEHGRSLAGTGYASGVKSDPFHDETEDHYLGRASIFLDPLLLLVPIDEWVAVVDDNV